jgi:DNA polymerase-3 subunit gamma/tau
MLEDTPAHVYFILCTTEPSKLLNTIRTRCTHLELRAVGRNDMTALLNRVAEAEGIALTEDVVDAILDVADGSPRRALVILDQIAGAKTETDQLRAIESGNPQAQGIELARALLSGSWGDCRSLLGKIENLETGAEGIRRLVMSYMASVLVKSQKENPRVFAVLEEFREPFYDCGKGRIVLACYRVFFGGES